MTCTTLTVSGAVTRGYYKWVLEVDTAWSFGSIATAAARIADWLSGISFFGYELDRTLFSGWNIEKVEYTANTIEVYFKEVGSPAILAVIAALWPYIVWLLRFFGIVLLGSKLIDLGTNVVAHEEANAERVQDKDRADCIKASLDAGRTPQQAMEICQAAYPQGSKPVDYGLYAVAIAGILGLAYILGQRR